MIIKTNAYVENSDLKEKCEENIPSLAHHANLARLLQLKRNSEEDLGEEGE